MRIGLPVDAIWTFNQVPVSSITLTPTRTWVVFVMPEMEQILMMFGWKSVYSKTVNLQLAGADCCQGPTLSVLVHWVGSIRRHEQGQEF
jgi:hypothetical protein